MILKSITHHIDTNTLEAVWEKEVFDGEGQVTGFERAKCTSYSSEQRTDFIADTGAPQYADLAEWAE